jgi:hypothetical protein
MNTIRTAAYAAVAANKLSSSDVENAATTILNTTILVVTTARTIGGALWIASMVAGTTMAIPPIMAKQNLLNAFWMPVASFLEDFKMGALRSTGVIKRGIVLKKLRIEQPRKVGIGIQRWSRGG